MFRGIKICIPALILSLLSLNGCNQAPDETPIMKKYPDSKVEMKLVKVTEHVYYVQGAAGMATENEGFISNAGVIITKDGVVLLDALGSPSLAKMLMQKIREVTDKPVKKVIVTHYHADHIYGLQLFKELGAEIYAPLAALDYLGSPTSAERLEERRLSLDPWVNDDTQLVSPDHKLNSNLKFNFGGLDFEITFVGSAHSEGDLTLYVAQDRVLFSGDIIFEGRVPFLGDANTKTWLATLEKMKTANLTALIPGHGPAARDPNQALLATAGYLAFMRDKMGAAAQDFVPFAEAYKKTDWSAYEKLPAFEAANRRNAYQVYLSMEAELMQQ